MQVLTTLDYAIIAVFFSILVCLGLALRRRASASLENYFLGGVATVEGKAKSLLTRRLGWADLSGADAGLAVGLRYFWQLHPKPTRIVHT